MKFYRIRKGGAPVLWHFKDPDTGHEYKAKDKISLINQIAAYRAQNELQPIHEIGVVIENYLALLPENTGQAETIELKRGFLAYLKGGIALLDFVFYGEKAMVAPGMAEIRAGICTSCPQNQFPDKGPFISWADEMALACTGGKKTSFHDRLGNCMACTCNLRSKIWYKGPFRLAEDELNLMPSFCWQRQEFLKEQKVSAKS